MIASSATFAQLVGISEQKARRALKVCFAGGTWRGVRLDVRVVPSRGGSSGLAYEVARDSIPQRLLARSKTPLNAISKASEGALTALAPATDTNPASTQIAIPLLALPP